MNEISILKPDDWHVHFRDSDIAKTVVPLHSNIFNRCLVMPNVPQILNSVQAFEYKNKIEDIANNRNKFEPIMTIMLQDETTPNLIANMLPIVKACKLYPKGVTTGSQHGISDVKALAKIFEIMQIKNLVLCIHAEDPNTPILDREARYIYNEVGWIVKHFPGLKVIIEHISTKEAIDFVRENSVNVAATITAHHLSLTLDDLLVGGLHLHHFCYPVVKTIENRNKLKSTALYDDSGKFFFGSDTAPHLKQNKERSCCAAGIFMPAEIAMNVLIELFKDYMETDIHYLERFTSINGAKFYGYPVTNERITFIKQPWVVPEEHGGIVSFMAGKTLNWKLKP